MDLIDLLISPAEPKLIKELGIVHSLPETYGADILFSSENGLCGIQRKEFPNDFLASLYDGRLEREVAQLQRCDYFRALVFEGKPRWLTNGQLDNNYRAFSKSQLLSLQHSLWLQGIFTVWTTDVMDTVDYIYGLVKWAGRTKHLSLLKRPNPQGIWGTASAEDWSRHLLQSFQGVGPELAQRIVQKFNGPPLQWTVTEKELMQVEGLGKEKARRLISALEKSLTNEEINSAQEFSLT